MLHDYQAVEIYQAKLSSQAKLVSGQHSPHAIRHGTRGFSREIAVLSQQYGVSSRTIRDIWNRKSWGYATKHMWCEEDITSAVGSGKGGKSLLLQVQVSLSFKANPKQL